MRIISGSHRGRQIFPDKNFTARPTTDFAKENIFNVLNNYVDIEGAAVLDLFSGTGSISYEFASRGAKEVTAIELNYNHYSFIKRTAGEIGFRNIKVFKIDEKHFGSAPSHFRQRPPQRSRHRHRRTPGLRRLQSPPPFLQPPGIRQRKLFALPEKLKYPQKNTFVKVIFLYNFTIFVA